MAVTLKALGAALVCRMRYSFKGIGFKIVGVIVEVKKTVQKFKSE